MTSAGVPPAPGLLFSGWPAASKVSPSAAGWPERGSAPSRLSKEWFSIMTAMRWSKGMASLTVPAGRSGNGRLSGLLGAAVPAIGT